MFCLPDKKLTLLYFPLTVFGHDDAFGRKKYRYPIASTPHQGQTSTSDSPAVYKAKRRAVIFLPRSPDTLDRSQSNPTSMTARQPCFRSESKAIRSDSGDWTNSVDQH